MAPSTKDIIQKTLQSHFKVSHLEIKDDSDLHKNHSGAIESGGGHYTIVIVSSDFRDKKMIERHRMVYKALGEYFKNKIHALVLKTLTPEEQL